MGVSLVNGFLYKKLHSLVEDWAIVTSVALRGKVHAIGRVLRECTHEALQRLPHARRRALGRVCGVGDVRSRVCTTGVLERPLWASGIWQTDDVATVGVDEAMHRVGIAEADLGWVVDEEHVRYVAG